MKKTAKIYYFSLTDEMLREGKLNLNWFASTKFEDILAPKAPAREPRE